MVEDPYAQLMVLPAEKGVTQSFREASTEKEKVDRPWINTRWQSLW